MFDFVKKMFNGGREPFSPDLIDLVEYEKECLYARAHGREPFPPRSLFLLSRRPKKRTPAEIQAMRDSSAAAREIWNRYKNP